MTSTNTEVPTLFTHTKRPQWGAALLAWARTDKRAYQFEDGKLRLFKQGYFHLLRPIDQPLDETLELIEELETKLNLSHARREAQAEARRKGQQYVTMKQQIEVFERRFPDGFDDPAFVSLYRGSEDGRRLKRHCDPAIVDAQAQLSEPELRAMVQEGDWTSVFDRLVEVTTATSMTSARKHRGILDQLPVSRYEAVARSLVDMLYGGGDPAERFDAWVSALSFGKRPATWMLATAVPSLVHPDTYLPVRRSVIEKQVRSMAPTLTLDKKPTGRQYVRLCKMGERVIERLKEGGHAPRDMHDVRAFIWETLRPKAKTALKGAGRSTPDDTEPIAA